MPKPRRNEKRSDFVSRCIPIVLEEGTAKDQKQAAAICHSMFDRKGDSMKTNQFEHLVTNLTANGVRYDTMEGKEYLVVPMIMITTGVHAGSNGPLYYPEEELSKTPAAWNAKPIVVYHPQINGRGVSACDPDIFTSRRVGLIMNTRYEDGKLKAEAWLDPSRMDLVDPRIREHIDAGKMMELSTGLFTDNEEVEGEWRGKRYVAVARNYRPDHLALLPDKVGACSIKDGAGFLRLNERQQSELMEFGVDLEQAFEEVIQNAFQKAKERVSQASQEPSRLTLDTAFESVLDRDHYFENEQEITDNFLWRSQKQRKWYFANRDKVKAAERKAGKGKSKFGGGSIRGGEEPGAAPKKGGDGKIDPNRSEQKTISGRRRQGKVNIADAAASLETAGYKLGRATTARPDLFQSLQEAVTQNYGPNSFVEDIYDSEVVFYNTEDSRHYRQSYVLDQNDLPQLNATPPVAVEAGNDHPSSFVETDDMAKRELVDQLVSNELTQWQEEDRDLLMSFSEPMLRRMLPVVNEEDEESEEGSGDEEDTLNDSDDNEERVAPPPISDGNKPSQNKDNQSVKDLPPTDNQRRASRAVTAEEYINNAPPEIREVLQAGLETAKAERQRLINTIVANENNPFDPKFLATKSIQELRGLAQLAKGRGNAAGMQQEEELPPMFLGAAGGPVGNMLTNNEEPEPLIRPSLDYSSAS